MTNYETKQVKKTLRNIKNMFQETFKSIDDQTIIRRRKIFSNHILCAMLFRSANNCGLQEALLDMKIKELINDDVTHPAINQKVTSGKFSEHFFSLTNKIINQFFSNGKRTFGVDGSQVNLSSRLHKNGFRKVQTQTHCQGLLTLIFDTDKKIPIEYRLTPSTNERTAFYDSLMKIPQSSLRKNDLFIFDRGYFSCDLVGKILSLDKDFIFRLPRNLSMVKNLQGDDQIISINGKPLRVIKYQIPSKSKTTQVFKTIKSPSMKRKIINEGKISKTIPAISMKPKAIKKDVKMNDYYLGTSLLDPIKYPIEVLKELYHQRWSVEECYKTIKGTFHDGTFHSILPESIECEMAVQQFLIIMTRLIMSLIDHSKNSNINYKISAKKVANDILPLLMFNKKNSYLKIICGLLNKLENIKIQIRPGRSFPRKKRFCSDKFVHNKKEIS
jgi:hypothetical protein